MVFCLKQFSWQTLDLKTFGAGRLRLSALSPSTAIGMDEVCHLCPSFDVAVVTWDHLSVVLITTSVLAALNARLPHCAGTLGRGSTSQLGSDVSSRLRVQRVKVFPGEHEAHSAAKGREFISLVQASFALF